MANMLFRFHWTNELIVDSMNLFIFLMVNSL